MAAAHGDGFPGGGVHGDSLKAITHYFEQRSCKQCDQPYTSEGIEFLRQEPGVIVVRVGCAACGHPLGIALVGMSGANQTSTCQHGRPGAGTTSRPAHPNDWTKKDVDRLGECKPISYDDVLAAHEFFSNLSSDWSRFLPKLNRQKNPT